MAKANLAANDLAPAPTAPAREALRSSISARDTAEVERAEVAGAIDRAEKALGEAKNRAYAAQDVIEADTAKQTDRLADWFQSGVEVEPDKTAEAARADLRRAERDGKQISDALEALRGRLAQADVRLKSAQGAVAEAVEDELAICAERALSEARAAQEALGTKRAAIVAIMAGLSRSNKHSDLWKRLNDYKSAPLVPHEFNGTLARHPETHRWAAFAEALTRDADVPAPR